MFKSVDGGDNWSPLKYGLDDGHARSIDVDPRGPEALHAVFQGLPVQSLDPNCFFEDDFENGDLSAWSAAVP